MIFRKTTLKKLNNWLDNNDIDCYCHFGRELSFMPNENKIVIARKYDKSVDKYFLSYLKSIGLKNEYNIIMLSILHELGHFYTVDNFSYDEWITDAAYKITGAFCENENATEEEYYFLYWNCVTEKVANEWVVNFCNDENNKDKIAELENIILAN